MASLPLARTVYFGVRQVSESPLERAAGYGSIVLVEYPREGVYTVGFVTDRAPGVTRAATGEDLHTVFTPDSPDPTAGRPVLVPDDGIRGST